MAVQYLFKPVSNHAALSRYVDYGAGRGKKGNGERRRGVIYPESSRCRLDVRLELPDAEWVAVVVPRNTKMARARRCEVDPKCHIRERSELILISLYSSSANNKALEKGLCPLGCCYLDCRGKL